MNTFFTQKTCDRCGSSLSNGRTMSMFNKECICMKCKDKERNRSDYKKATNAVRKEEQNGNRDFEGIGL